MFVDCNRCSTTYHVPDDLLGEESRHFRCSACDATMTLRSTPAVEAAVSPRLAENKPPPPKTSPPTVGAGERPSVSPKRVVPALAILGMVFGGMAAVGARAQIASFVPAAAGVYAWLGLPLNARGLAIEAVKATTLRDANGKRLLLVMGEVVNLRDMTTRTSDLRIALRDDKGRELYVWSVRAPKPALAPGERVSFRAKLAAPPVGVRDVLVKVGAPGDKASFSEAGL